MRKHRRSSVLADDARPMGIFRINIMEDGRVVGDSGWRYNQITDLGAQHYLVENLINTTGSASVTHMGIGTGAAPAAGDTILANELAARVTVTKSVVASRTAQFTAQFASAVFSTQGAKTINNLGLFYTSSGGSIFAGNTYTTSQWNTNQDVNATYQIRFP